MKGPQRGTQTPPLLGASRHPAHLFTTSEGDVAHGQLGLHGRSAGGQCRTTHKDPSCSQLRWCGGPQRHLRCLCCRQFIQSHDVLNDLCQLNHLHGRQHDLRRHLGVRDSEARTRLLLRRGFVLLVMARTALVARWTPFPNLTARRSGHHECQHEKCEDLPEAVHLRS